MKNIYTILKIFSLLLIMNMMGCYDLQSSYDYTSVNANPYLDMTTWEFIEMRQDTFSIFKEAVELVDSLNPGFKDYYKQTDRKYTYLLLDNAGFTGFGGVFRNNGNVSSVKDIEPNLLKNILLYHIVDGFYHSLDVSGSLNFNPVNVITLMRSQDGVMTMNIDNRNSMTYFSRLVINNNLGLSPMIRASTSNLIATNGAIHVFSKQLIYIQ